MAKLPDGFYSWMHLYFYLKERDIKYQTVRMAKRQDDGTVITKKLTMRRVEVNAWREISKDLPKNHEIFNAIRMLHMADNGQSAENVRKFLEKILENMQPF